MPSISDALTDMVKANLAPKEFSTGSKGFHVTEKITVDGVRYQASAQAVLIGSKGRPKVKVQATTDEVATALSALVAQELADWTFSTGRTGYRVHGKVDAHSQRFQVSVQAVRLA